MNSKKYVVCPSCGVILEEFKAKKEENGKTWFECPGCKTIAPKFETITEESPDFTGNRLEWDRELEKKLLADYYVEEENKTIRGRVKKVLHQVGLFRT
jgi:hypothetical protein